MSGEDKAKCQATINVLPDDVLLEIFHVYKKEPTLFGWCWCWKMLAHVCRRWRRIVLASPQILDLKIVCNDRTPTRTSLDIWPPFPIIITYFPGHWGSNDEEGPDNIIAALERHDRISQISFGSLPDGLLERFTSLMQEPLPALTHLRFSTSAYTLAPVVLPKAFLGGSAPRLQSLTLSGCAFPTLPTLLVSASDLVYLNLNLSETPDSMFPSPETMVTCLGVLPNLRQLVIGVKHLSSLQGGTSLHPSTRTVLPALSVFDFKGVNKYLDDFVARVDTPLLDTLHIRFPMGTESDIDIPQLSRFIVRAERLWPFDRARLELNICSASISLGPGVLLSLRCDFDRESLLTAQLCNRLSPLLSHVEQLIIRGDLGRRGGGAYPSRNFSTRLSLCRVCMCAMNW
ncbi:hypothetical protein BJV74DRAFT_151094 [Russula compacta]|nr:hypothetical protein BJV74DRAFT_151094 [Russula compacta]